MCKAATNHYLAETVLYYFAQSMLSVVLVYKSLIQGQLHLDPPPTHPPTLLNHMQYKHGGNYRTGEHNKQI